ncbi:Ppx/GppA phosphatase family protein [Alicyclobacillus dauci]|uniref:Ppx/GppA family phosphatase n=1 Tax=Alicyclobacillus dauci TaxID=1475485 RepID=A0ABY6Z291_9BACL|nr:Ppx/GppA phosphatase family protein [Alicyclobacillus dauci]WAH36946.1 Ppx/GppA family phosphatase [Alicyclobacillus dauci]
MADEMNAVIDLGSNSVRVVIYEHGPSGTQKEIDTLKQSVRLTSHLDENNVITETGIQLTVQVVGLFKQLCDSYGVVEIIGVATQAVRVAVNRDELLNRIFAETGIRFRVITGEEEARYGYLAAVNSLPLEDGITVDVGGGSTEITYFRQRNLIHYASIPYGAVSLTKEFTRNDPTPSKILEAMNRAIENQLDRYPWLEGLGCPVIGMGGTARTVARVHQDRRKYPLKILHGYEMCPMEVTAMLDMVCSMPVKKRSKIGGLSGERADIIVAGIAILDQVLKRVRASKFVISNKGLRDGILIEQVLRTRGEQLLPDMLVHSIANIHVHFHLDRQHAIQVWKLTGQLLSEMVKHNWLPDSSEMRRCLHVASMLHDIGRTISIYNTRDHNFYLLLQVPLFGVSHRERLIAAAITAFKSTKQTNRALVSYQELLEDEDFTTITRLGVLLGLVKTLDRTSTGAVQSIDLLRDQGEWILRVHAQKPLGLQLNLALEWLKEWRKVFQREIRLEVDPFEQSLGV